MFILKQYYYVVYCLETKNAAIKIKNKIKGNSTKNQETIEYPDLQIKFNTQVRNKMYKILIINIRETLDTLHSYIPKQYTFSAPIFWKNIIAKASIDNTKYKRAGSHKFFNPTICIIYNSKEIYAKAGLFILCPFNAG